MTKYSSTWSFLTFEFLDLLYNLTDNIDNQVQGPSPNRREVEELTTYEANYCCTTIKFYKPINSDELRLKQNDMTIVIEENPVGLTTKRVEFNLLAAVMGFLYMYVLSMLILFLHTIGKCLFYSTKSKPSFYMFYKKLSHKRAERERDLQVEEYIESYRHFVK